MSIYSEDNRSDDDIMYEAVAKFKGGIKESRDPDSQLRRKAAYDQQVLQEEKLNEIRGKEWAAAEARKQREEESKFLAITGGRHELITKDRQVLFEDSICPYCDAAVKSPLSGWNPNLQIAGLSLGDTYESSHVNESTNNFDVPHQCDPSNTLALWRAIAALRKEIKDFRHESYQNFKRGPFL